MRLQDKLESLESIVRLFEIKMKNAHDQSQLSFLLVYVIVTTTVTMTVFSFRLQYIECHYCHADKEVLVTVSL